MPRLNAWGCAAATLHGRTKEQRYTREADWSYIETIAAASASVPLIGNGDVYSYEDAVRHLRTMRVDDTDDGDGDGSGVCALMLARGALIKPWLFTEIKERRHWDISSSERFDMLKDFTTFGLEQWGSDDQGVLNVRKFLMYAKQQSSKSDSGFLPKMVMGGSIAVAADTFMSSVYAPCAAGSGCLSFIDMSLLA